MAIAVLIPLFEISVSNIVKFSRFFLLLSIL